MAKVEMYFRDMCPYCLRADRLLASKDIEVERINIWEVPGARDQMIERSGGGNTVPQIFIDGKHIGGSDALGMLEASSELDRLLGLGAAAKRNPLIHAASIQCCRFVARAYSASVNLRGKSNSRHTESIACTK